MSEHLVFYFDAPGGYAVGAVPAETSTIVVTEQGAIVIPHGGRPLVVPEGESVESVEVDRLVSRLNEMKEAAKCKGCLCQDVMSIMQQRPPRRPPPQGERREQLHP